MLNANMNDGKSLVIILVSDTSGCSHIRLRHNALWYCGHEHFGFTPVITPIPIFDPMYLARTKAIVIQRPVSPVHLEMVRRYKALQPKFGYKLVSEFDDQVWEIDGQGIPDYNTASLHFDIKGTTAVAEQTFPLFDEMVVSTEFLKVKLIERFQIPEQKIHVIRNVVPRFLWNYPRKENKTEDLVKPKVLYSGSPCHYRNPVPARKPSPQEPNGFPGITPLKGDMNNAWCDWVIKNVNENKIDFICMGALPWFWEPIKDKIRFVQWVDSQSYPRLVMSLGADFQIAPLVSNVFNKCKSALRHTESCAAGTILLGTVFSDDKWSPYEEINPKCKVLDTATVEDIDNIFFNLCKKENYNEVLNWQYNFINENGYWMESNKHAQEWLCMIDGGNNNFI